MAESSDRKIEVKPKKTRRPPPPSVPPDMNHEHIAKLSEESGKCTSMPNNNMEDAESERSAVTTTQKNFPVATTQQPNENQYYAGYPHHHHQVPLYQSHHPMQPYGTGHLERRNDHSPNRKPYERRDEPQRDIHYHPHEAHYNCYPQAHGHAPPGWNYGGPLPPQLRMQERLKQQQHRFAGQAPSPMMEGGAGGYVPPSYIYEQQRQQAPYHGQPPPYYHQQRYPQGISSVGDRRGPPMENFYMGPGGGYQVPFQPYVDSDFQGGETLGENRPNTFTVSVTSLPSGRGIQSEECENASQSPPSRPCEDTSDDNSESKKENKSAVKKQCFASPDEKPKGLAVADHIKTTQQHSNSENQRRSGPETEATNSAGDPLFFLKKNPSANPLSPTSGDVSTTQSSSNTHSRKHKSSSSKRTNEITGYRKCLIMRDRKGVKNRLNPTYNLYSQDVPPGTPPQLIMIAQKTTSRTPNYRFFDMTKSITTDKLDKHSRNYVGKLRGNFNRDEYTAYGKDKEIMCAVVYDKSGVVSQIRDGALPRKMGVLLPYDKVSKKLEELNSTTVLSPTKVERNFNSSDEEMKSDDDGSADGVSPEQRLANMFDQVESRLGESCAENGDSRVTTSVANIMQGRIGKSKSSKQYLQLSSKEPTYEKKNYRLNFHGRVKLPSVKNYQLIQPDGDPDNVWTQFGKVTEDKFHLDYKEPMDMFSAFALAITQFDY